jgi:hypothetical protein
MSQLQREPSRLAARWSVLEIWLPFRVRGRCEPGTARGPVSLRQPCARPLLVVPAG